MNSDWAILFGLICACGMPLRAEVCNPTDLQGPYGFQLSGETTISGEPKPVAGVGRMVLGPEGSMNGYSTVMFAGYLLGNPVTGTFEAHWDCSVTWILQDDGGSFQHFSGVAGSGGKSVHYSQTDAGGAQHGTMAKIASECKPSDLRDAYTFELSGSTIAMVPGGTSSTVTAKGLIQANGKAGFQLSLDGNSEEPTDVGVTVDSECIVTISLTLPTTGSGTSIPTMLRGVLIAEGKQILAIDTDPGSMISATFTAHGAGSGFMGTVYVP